MFSILVLCTRRVECGGYYLSDCRLTFLWRFALSLVSPSDFTNRETLIDFRLSRCLHTLECWLTLTSRYNLDCLFYLDTFTAAQARWFFSICCLSLMGKKGRSANFAWSFGSLFGSNFWLFFVLQRCKRRVVTIPMMERPLKPHTACIRNSRWQSGRFATVMGRCVF